MPAGSCGLLRTGRRPVPDCLTAYLVTNAHLLGLTTDTNIGTDAGVATTITKLFGFQTLNATIDASTTGADIAFNAGEGATAVHPNGQPNQIVIIGGGPFQIRLTVK
jgi:hypothetical protein